MMYANFLKVKCFLLRKRKEEEFHTEGTEFHGVHRGRVEKKNFTQRARSFTGFTEEEEYERI